MKKVIGPLFWGMCCMGGLSLIGCGDGTQPSAQTIGRTAQAMVGADAGGNDAVVVLGASGNPSCTGVAIGANVILTTSTCANIAGITSTPSSQSIGRVAASADTDFLYAAYSGVVLYADDGSRALIRVGSGSITGSLTQAAPVAGPVTVSGVASAGVVGTDRRTLAATASGTGPTALCVTPDNASQLLDTSDEGAPVLNGSGQLVGVLTASGGCDAQSMKLIPAQGLQFGTGQLRPASSGDKVPFLWTLGGSGLFYELSILLTSSGQVFTTDTTIPKALPALYASGTTPNVALYPAGGSTSDLSLPQSKSTPGSDSSAADGITDITVTVGPNPSGRDPNVAFTPTGNGAGDGTGDTDAVDPTDTSVPLALSAAMGMSYVLSGADVIDATNAVRPSWKGFPSVDGRDGRFVRLGPGSGSPRTSKFTAFLNCSSGTLPVVDVFDADTGGAYDNNSGGAANTCMRIIVDPDGSGQGSITEPNCIISKLDSVATFPDDSWTNLHDGGAFASSCSTSAGNYRIEILLMDPTLSSADAATSCAAVTPAEADVKSGVLSPDRNLFKIRSNCDIALTGQAFTLHAVDANGQVFSKASDGDATTVIDTTYDRHGTFAYKINVLGGGNPHVKSVDADDCDTGCSSVGRSRGIHFLPLSTSTLLPYARTTGTGSAWAIQAGDITGAGGRILNLAAYLAGDPPQPFASASTAAKAQALRYQNPSGQFDGVPEEATSSDIGDFTVTAGATTDFAVLWRNVRAQNGFAVFIPTGSPIVYPVLSSDSNWRPVAPVQTAALWASDSAALTPLLPIEVGRAGGRKVATTVAQAQALLLSSNALLANVTAFTLNLKLAQARSINLNNAVVRGMDILAVDAIDQANALLATPGATPGVELAALVALNQGLFQFTYPDPELPPLGDEDGDTIINVQDNCPTRDNPDQANTVISDDLGDKCDPVPNVDCVIRRSGSRFTAFFGYDNPYRRRQLGGAFNTFVGGAPNRGQPTMFRSGIQQKVFAVDSTGAQLSWRVAGNTAVTSATSPVCTGGEVFRTLVAERTALFARERIEVGDRFVMTNYATMVAGSSGVLLGFDTNVGDVLTSGPVTRRDRVHVFGDLRANYIAPPGYNNLVDGMSVAPAGVALDDISLAIPLPSSRVPLNPVPNDATLTLAPGNYTNLAAGDRATIRLTTGLYDFNTLAMNNDSKLIVDDAAGPVRVIIRGVTNSQNPTAFAYRDRVSVTSLSGGQPQLIVEYLGTQTAQLTSSFDGFIHAANAQLELVRGTYLPNGSVRPFTGVFFARRIVAGNDVKVAYATPPGAF